MFHRRRAGLAGANSMICVGNGRCGHGITSGSGTMGRLVKSGGVCVLDGVIVACVALLPSFAFSQGAQQTGVAQAQDKIQVHTEDEIAPVTVLDKQGGPVLDLMQKDVQVYDNGVEQTIEHWDLGGDPLAVALVIETSSQIEMMAPVIHGMSSIFTETAMALNGETTVIKYDSTVDVRQTFTHDHDDVQQAIVQVKFEAPEMRLCDGMAEAVEQLETRPPNYRRVMLIVGESQDLASDAKLGLGLRDAQLANIAIYTIGPSSTSADLRFGEQGLNGGDKLPPIELPKPLLAISSHGPGGRQDASAILGLHDGCRLACNARDQRDKKPSACGGCGGDWRSALSGVARSCGAHGAGSDRQ
jgi:hypothetical protein